MYHRSVHKAASLLLAAIVPALSVAVPSLDRELYANRPELVSPAKAPAPVAAAHDHALCVLLSASPGLPAAPPVAQGAGAPRRAGVSADGAPPHVTANPASSLPRAPPLA
ncbi:MAG: hypothetical protein HY703_03345 [Gemmatimonadetes bacterium]|nr:hypothetical protein [Gemmatimonadota bacterium]